MLTFERSDWLTLFVLKMIYKISPTEVDFETSVKVLGVHIDDKLSFSQQFSYAANKTLQTFGSIKRSFRKNNSLNPNTFKTLCQAVVIPRWTYLTFIWGDRTKFKIEICGQK